MAAPRAPTHHPSEAHLLDYASGALREPVALVVATHLALCPACRRAVAELEAVGGALLETLPPEPLADDSLSRTLARLDGPERSERAGPPAASPAAPTLPRPLRDYVGSLDQVAWHRFGPIFEARLLTGAGGLTTRLLKVHPATALPRHTHDGLELTLVLQGGFSDSAGHYLRGDLCEAGHEFDHRPVADPDEECICLAVTDAPLRLTGWLGRLLNPLLRI